MRTSLLILVIFCAGCGKSDGTKISVDSPEVGIERDQIVVEGDVFNNGRVKIEITGFAYEKLHEKVDGKLHNVRLNVHNLQKNNKLDYRSWAYSPTNNSAREKRSSHLEDEFGNTYEILPAIKGAPYHKDQVTHSDLMPGESISDILFFEKLVPNAKKIELTLQGNNLTNGKDLVFNLELPENPVQNAAEPSP